MKQVLLAPFLILLRSQICSTRQGLNLLSQHSPGIPVYELGGLGKEDGTYSQHPFQNVYFIYKEILWFFFQNRQPGSCLRTLILIIIIYYCAVTIYYRKIKALLTLVQKTSQVPAPSSLITQRQSVNFLPALKAVCLPVSNTLPLAFVFSPAQPYDTLPGFNQCPLH